MADPNEPLHEKTKIIAGDYDSVLSSLANEIRRDMGLNGDAVSARTREYVDKTHHHSSSRDKLSIASALVKELFKPKMSFRVFLRQFRIFTCIRVDIRVRAYTQDGRMYEREKIIPLDHGVIDGILSGKSSDD